MSPQKLNFFSFLWLESAHQMNGKEASQIKNILAPGVADHHGHWLSCKLDINNCSSNQLDPMQDNDLSIIHLKGMKFILKGIRVLSRNTPIRRHDFYLFLLFFRPTSSTV
ncbi:uncharacterized protein LOC123908827 isoform X1 [Trifolium pratense]|uniref:uncharacterized protein LOC123908827 isoform X1 n=1 Tax=Trifolium pratense TaxID=57577 RepID=UPI001E6960E9|nr:uncharacterized protein LOC123908827 isoform X1 [Trifolium pratense]